MAIATLLSGLGFGALMMKFGPRRFGGNRFCQRMRGCLAALFRGHENTYRNSANVQFSGDGVQVNVSADPQTIATNLVNLNWQDAANALMDQPSGMRDADQSERM